MFEARESKEGEWSKPISTIEIVYSQRHLAAVRIRLAWSNTFYYMDFKLLNPYNFIYICIYMCIYIYICIYIYMC